jgi:hypothetical protein
VTWQVHGSCRDVDASNRGHATRHLSIMARTTWQMS